MAEAKITLRPRNSLKQRYRETCGPGSIPDAGIIDTGHAVTARRGVIEPSGRLSLQLVNAGVWLFCLAIVLIPLGTVATYGLASGRFSELAEPDILRATWHSISSATASAAIALFLAIIFVLAIEHTNLPGRRILRLLALSPLLVPPFIGAMSWVGLFGPASAVNNLAEELLGSPLWIIYGGEGVILLLALHSYPIAYLLLAAALARIPPELEQAARTSGAGNCRLLRDITLPLLRPAMISAFVLVAVSNLADFGIPAILGAPDGYETLATVAYRFIRSGTVEDPVQLTACVGVVLMIIVGAGLWVMRICSRRRDNVETSAAPSQVLELPRPWVLGIVVWALVLFLTLAPLLALISQSLIPAPGVPLSLETLTLDHFRAALTSSWTAQGATTSLSLALGAAVITGLVGLTIGTITTRTSLPGRSLLRGTALLPLAIPGLIVAIGWLMLSPYLGLFNSPWLILIAYVMSFLALVVQAVEAPMRSTSGTLEEAARVSGASEIRAFSDISVRLALPAAAAGALLVFLTAVRELTISALLLAPNAQTLGVAIFNLQQAGSYGPAAALAVVVTVLGLLGLGLVTGRLQQRAGTRRR